MFDKAFDDLMKIEGGYSDHPNDKGGKTRYGITEAAARENGYKGDMATLPLETAKAIYKKCYWDKMQLDDIAKLSYDIANQLFQCGVNMGTVPAVKMLQRALNCFVNQLKIDGILGHQTILALLKLIDTEASTQYIKPFVYKPRQEYIDRIIKMLKAQQIMRYMEIVEKDASQAVFLNGWINRVQL